MFPIVTIIGIGLIGGSMARAIKEAWPETEIRMADVSQEAVSQARAMKLGSSCTTDLAEAVKGADLVVLAVPVGAMGQVAAEISTALKAGALVTDVGSVKGAVIKAVAPMIPEGVHFVPGHPIAGTEKSGPDSGFTELFQGRWVVLTPLDGLESPEVAQLTRLWQGLGAMVELMDPEHHDVVLAITSHIPHLIAYSIVGTASDYEKVSENEVIKFSAAGFRDFTRIAASDPIMWRDVFLGNKEAVLEMLGRTVEDLLSLQRQIRWGDGEALEKLFSRTRGIRRSIIDAGQDSDLADFGRPHGNAQDKDKDAT